MKSKIVMKIYDLVPHKLKYEMLLLNNYFNILQTENGLLFF